MEMGINFLLVTVILLNFLSLGLSQIASVIRIAAFQGVLLGLMPLLIEESQGSHIPLLCLATILIKGGLIPLFLFRALRDVQIRREVQPLLGPIPSLFLGALGTILGLVFAQNLPAPAQAIPALILPTSFSTVLTGFVMLITRHKALTQVVGFLVLENGIYVFGLTLLSTMPSLVELGVLLDLLVCIFVFGIILNHIRQAFSSLDSNKLTALREE